MFPATTKGGGMAFGFPDTCLTPAAPSPVPVPYPNMAQCATALASTCTMRVKIMNMPVLHQSSEIPMTSGDEGGTVGGVASGTFAQKATFTMGVPTVKVEGNPVLTLLKPSQHNGASPNLPVGSIVTPSQTVVMIGP